MRTVKPLVYVAGPITKPEPMENVHRALMFASSIAHKVTPFVPHLTCLWHMVEPRDYEEWMEYDFAVIHHCRALVRMKGESPGADREVALATELDLPVFIDGTSVGVPALIDWAETGMAEGAFDA